MPGCTNGVSAPASGRNSPSKMWPSKPGPSGIASGARSPSTIAPGLQPRRVFVDLRDDFVAIDAHDFAQQRVVADANRFAHRERTRCRRAQHRTGDPANRRAAHALRLRSGSAAAGAPISARSASEPGKRAVDDVAACGNLESRAGGVGDDEFRRLAQRRRQRRRKRVVARRPAIRGHRRSATPRAAAALRASAIDGCDPGSAAFGLAPAIAKRRGQLSPAGREQIAARRCSRRRRCVASRACAAARRASDRAPLFVEGLAHAAARLGVRRRDCVARRAPRASPMIASQRRLRSASTRSSSACVRDSSVMAHPRGRAARAVAPRDRAAVFPPRRSGTISVSGASAAWADARSRVGNAGCDVGGDQNERRALRVPTQAPASRRRRRAR